MSILTALAAQYDRLADRGEVAPIGMAPAGISFEIVLNPDGTPDGPPRDLRDFSGKKPRPRTLLVPAAPKDRRGLKAVSAFLWDTSDYALGLEGELVKEGEQNHVRPVEGRNSAKKHSAFVSFHTKILQRSDDEGLKALLNFLAAWTPGRFSELAWPTDMLGGNVVFRLANDVVMGVARRLHERPAAQQLWRSVTKPDGRSAPCLVLGVSMPIARLHPPIKGAGGQPAGPLLVSFNESAFESYGQRQGDNAPVSAAVTHAYGTALNAMLEDGSGHKARVADTTIVFWADAREGEASAKAAETVLGAGIFDLLPPEPEAGAPPAETDGPKIEAAIDAVAAGRGAAALAPDLNPQTRVHILGLAPNNARLSVRFYHVGTFGDLATSLAVHWQDMAIEPRRWGRMTPPVWQLVQETAVHVAKEQGGKTTWTRAKNADPPPRLTGEVMRAILSGGRYPVLLARTVLLRIRAEKGRVTERRAALLLATHNRRARLDNGEPIPMGLSEDHTDIAYLLGRLFALYEWAEDAASGGRVATLRDRYFASASATPSRVFPVLFRSYTHDLAKLRKGDGKGTAVRIEKAIGAVMDKLPPHLPRALSLEAQAPFSVGYYHQAQDRYTKRADKTAQADAAGGADHSPQTVAEGAPA